MAQTNINKDDYLLIYKTSTTPFFPGFNVGLAHSGYLKKIFDNPPTPSKMITIVDGESVSWFYYKDMKEIAQKFMNTCFTYEFIDKIAKGAEKVEEGLFKFLNLEIAEFFNGELLNESGADMFSELFELYTACMEYIDLPGYLFQIYFAEKFSNDLLEEFDGTKQEKQNKLNILTANCYETFYEKYLKDLLFLKEHKKNVKDVVKENFWLIHDYIGTIIDEEYVKEDLSKHSIEELKERVESVPKRIEIFNEELQKCSPELKEKIVVYQKLNWFYHEQKKFIINQVNIFIRKIFEYKFEGITQSELKRLFMLKPVELIDILKKDISLEDVLSTIKDKYCYCMFKEELYDADPEYFKLVETDHVKELKGMTAYPGKLKGKAKIILNQSQMHLFESGLILVAPMTNVNYLPLMHKAKAILTEIGGLTSHAAIISRELKKPCIVGIKNLINTLKDEELIEIDADNGIVRKLSE